MATLYRILLTILAALLAWGVMAHAFGGWDGDPCARAFFKPEDIPTACLPIPSVP